MGGAAPLWATRCWRRLNSSWLLDWMAPLMTAEYVS